MKKLTLLFILLASSSICLSQVKTRKGHSQKKTSKKMISDSQLNGYKYVVVSKKGDPFQLGYTVSKELENYGFYSFVEGAGKFADFVACQALYCELIYTPSETISQNVKLIYKDCNGTIISKSESGCAICAYTVEGELRKAAIKAVRKLKSIKNYKKCILLRNVSWVA